jgi:hypothetical protein
MTLFDVLPVAGIIIGIICGFRLGLCFGNAASIIGGIVGGCIGFLCGRIPLSLVLKLIRRNLGGETVENLRAMLRDPACLTPNVILLELQSRGHNLELELPVVIEMLLSTDRDRRIRGWHAFASAYLERAKLLAEYSANDNSLNCERKLQSKLQMLLCGANNDSTDGEQASRPK